MTVTRTRRVINPSRSRPKAAKVKRRLTPKQIKHFGTKAQRASLKRRMAAKRVAPRKKIASHRNPVRKTVKRRNPVPMLLTIGAVNPQKKQTKRKRGNTVATKSKKRSLAAKKAARTRKRNLVARASNPRRRTYRHRANPRRRKANGTRIYVTRRNGRRRSGARRNPEVFGMRGGAAGKAILAGLLGVYATKTVTPMVASALPSVGGSPVISAVISAFIAWGGGMLVSKWDKSAGEGFMFGGLMQAGSQLLNLVVPANPLALSGLGDFQPASFSVPQNPIMAAARANAQIAAAVAATPKKAMSGVGAAAAFR